MHSFLGDMVLAEQEGVGRKDGKSSNSHEG